MQETQFGQGQRHGQVEVVGVSEKRVIGKIDVKNKIFNNLRNCIRHKLSLDNKPQVSLFFISPALPETRNLMGYDSERAVEVVDKFVGELRWGIKHMLPKKRIYDTGKGRERLPEKDIQYVYYYFEDGEGGYDCAFVETVEDFDDEDCCGLEFYRAYASIKGQIHPMFNEFRHQICEYPFNDKTSAYIKPSVEYQPVIYFHKSNGDLAMKTMVIWGRGIVFEYGYETDIDKKHERMEPYEASLMVDGYVSDDYNDGYYEYDCYLDAHNDGYYHESDEED